MTTTAQMRGRLVKALRSGEYKHGKNVLQQNDGGMCCLGVACAVSGIGEYRPSEETEAGHANYHLNGFVHGGTPP